MTAFIGLFLLPLLLVTIAEAKDGGGDLPPEDIASFVDTLGEILDYLEMRHLLIICGMDVLPKSYVRTIFSLNRTAKMLGLVLKNKGPHRVPLCVEILKHLAKLVIAKLCSSKEPQDNKNNFGTGASLTFLVLLLLLRLPATCPLSPPLILWSCAGAAGSSAEAAMTRRRSAPWWRTRPILPSGCPGSSRCCPMGPFPSRHPYIKRWLWICSVTDGTRYLHT